MVKRILIVDDDLAIRKLFILSLEDTGYQVDSAESGYKGLELAEKNNYEIIFLDLKMPGINGIETLKKLREFENDVMVYIITTFHKEFFYDLQELKKQGIEFELLKKPFDRHQLLEIINSFGKNQNKARSQ